MKIAGYLKSSMIDYPNTLASVVYTPSCNFSCAFCHNGELVKDNHDFIHQDIVFEHLDKRANILDGVVITGGEPTLQQNLIPFMRRLKSKGFKVKLDTNGYKPHFLRKILDENLADYIAMDIKNGTINYDVTTGIDVDMNTINESIDLIQNSGVDYEFRTTLIKEFHSEEDIKCIAKLVKSAKRFVFQQYEYSATQLEDTKYRYYTLQEMENFRGILKNEQISEIIIRGKY